MIKEVTHVASSITLFNILLFNYFKMQNQIVSNDYLNPNLLTSVLQTELELNTILIKTWIFCDFS